MGTNFCMVQTLLQTCVVTWSKLIKSKANQMRKLDGKSDAKSYHVATLIQLSLIQDCNSNNNIFFQKWRVQEKLVELYCNGTEQFGPIVHEILGSYAFQVGYG